MAALDFIIQLAASIQSVTACPCQDPGADTYSYAAQQKHTWLEK